MRTYYSKSKNAFYHESLKDAYLASDNWPLDLIEVTPKEVTTYQEGTSPEGFSLGHNKEGRPIWVRSPTESLEVTKQRAKDEIDKMAGNVRKSFVSSGELIEEEYKMVYEQVKVWDKEGRDLEKVPESVAYWSNLKSKPVIDAAEDILEAHSVWIRGLSEVRELRLEAKEVIDSCEEDRVEEIKRFYLSKLDSIKHKNLT